MALAVGLILCTVAAAAGQGLTLEQQRYFLACQLSLNVTETDYAVISDYSVASGTQERWQGYQGFRSVSEDEFFMAAGYVEEASLARRHQQEYRATSIGGVFATVLGVAIMLGGEGEAAILGGGVLAAIGAGVVGYANHRLDRNWAPYALAAEAADQYNAELRRQLPGDLNRQSSFDCPRVR
jgi:hypothetical protein